MVSILFLRHFIDHHCTYVLKRPWKAGHHSRNKNGVRSVLHKNLNHNFGGDVNGIAHLDPDFLRCRYRCRCCSRCSTQGLFGLTRRQVVKVTGILGNHISKCGWCKSSILLEWFWVFQNVFTNGSLSISISWQKKDYVCSPFWGWFEKMRKSKRFLC